MKKILTLLLSLCFFLPLRGQDTITLAQCYQLVQKHYPVLLQNPLLKQQLALALKNLNARYLPSLSLQAQATYQSDVTSLPLKLPGMDIPEVAKDQYRAVVDVQQLIFDGGSVRRQKKIQKTTSALLLQKQKITFHQLRKQLNEWYETVLITQAREKTLNLQHSNLEQQLQKIKSAIKNGIALSSQSDELKAALLQTEQQLRNLKAQLHSSLQALSLVTGKPLGDSVYLKLPETPTTDIKESIQRPELKQFSLKSQLLEQQSSLLKVNNLPKVSAFAQGGYGRPGLNMLNNDFDWFYMAGIRLKWNIWDWNQTQRKQRSLQIDARKLQLEKDNFLLQTNIALSQALSIIHSLEQSIQKDKQIVQLRNKIRKTASSRLMHGVITPTEYLIKLNDETAAHIQQKEHIIQLRFAQLNYQLLKNN